MRALLSEYPGDGASLAIGELPMPEPGEGEVRIKVHCAGLNYPDALIIADRYQVRPPRPFAPGIEVAGVIDAVGPGVRSLRIGQRCLALVRHGGIADFAVASEHVVAVIDDGLEFAEAAAMVVNYGTAWHALHDRARLRAGETVLILGASGTVGLAAIELGRALGAEVVAAVSTEAKADFARARGADRVLVYSPGEVDGRALAGQFKEVCGGGADCVLDPVGGAYGEAAFRSLVWGGRFLVAGFAAAMPVLPANAMLLKSMDVLGVSWGEGVMRRPGLFARHIAELAALHARGAIRPAPDRIVPIEAAGAAIDALSGRTAIGKTVVQL